MTLRSLLVAFACLTLAAGCGSGGSSKATPAATASAGSSAVPAVTGSITVFAASSLTTVFERAGARFTAANPGVHVEWNFAGSPTLRTQLSQGARADLLATADQPNMDQALAAHVVRDRGAVFARSRLAIAIPKPNPAHLVTPADLARPGIKLVLAQAGVPAGDYARQALQKMEADPAYGGGFRARVLANVVSDEPNVKAVLAKVQLGEADAGIVYTTDVTPDIADDVAIIPIPDALNVIASYPIALTADAANASTAEAFIRFLLSGEGQAILTDAGFLPEK